MKIWIILLMVLLVPLSTRAQKKVKPNYFTSPSLTLGYYAKRENQRMEIYYAMLVGDSCRNKGNMVGAEHYYFRAAAITDKIKDHGPYRNIILESIFDPLERLGELYLQTNNLRKAELYFDKAREEKDRHLHRHSVFRVSPYIGLAQVNFRKGDYHKAEINYKIAEKTLNAATTSFYSYPNAGRKIQAGLYETFMAKRDYPTAYKHLRRMTSGGLNGESIVPVIFEQNADYYMRTGDYAQSEYYLEMARIYSRNLPFSEVRHSILRTEALLRWSEGNTVAATKDFRELNASYRANVKENFASMTEAERELFEETFKSDLDLFSAYVVSNLNRDQSATLCAELYNNQLFGKALLLNQISKLKNQIAASNNTELKNKLFQWEQEKSELTNLYFSRKKDRTEIEQREARVEELERQINEQSSVLQTMNQEPLWQDVRDKLKDGEAAVEIVRVRKFNLKGQMSYDFSDSVVYAALFVDRKSEAPQCFIIENGNDLEERNLHYYRNSILTQQPDSISFNQFWLPLKNRLGGYTRLFISCDGAYNQINLNTLYNTRDKRYLLDEVDIVLVTNTKDILTPSIPLNSKQGVFFGRPNYKMNLMDSSLIPRAQTRSINSEFLEDLKDQEFADLPETETELTAISKVLQQSGWKSQINTGDKATVASLKATINPAVLHIATHGFFLQGDAHSNSMVRSGIVLSGINSAEQMDEDGVLTALEATGLHLDTTYLVVLSACETGLGEVKNGEGVYGLQRGFVVAGASHLLMSLWKVDDLATRFLMEEFYKAWLSSGDLHGAIKSAQVALRKNYPHPYYWGAFVLFGN